MTGGTDENHQKPQSRQSVYRPRFEPWTSRIEAGVLTTTEPRSSVSFIQNQSLQQLKLTQLVKNSVTFIELELSLLSAQKPVNLSLGLINPVYIATPYLSMTHFNSTFPHKCTVQDVIAFHLIQPEFRRPSHFSSFMLATCPANLVYSI